MRRDAARHDVRGTRRYRYTNTVHRIFYRPRNGTRCGSWSDEYRTFPSFQGKRIKQLLLPLLLLLFLPWFNRCSPSSRSRCIPRDAQVFLHAERDLLASKTSSKESNINFCSSQVSRFLSLDLASADLSILVLQCFAKHVRSSFIIMQIGERKREGEKGGSRFFFNGNLHVNPININERVTLRIP